MIKHKHIISMLVEDQPGVLTRISGMFARRSFNIDTITVGKTNQEGVSKIIVTVIGTDKELEQVEKQISKLIDVFELNDIEQGTERELCLIKINVDEDVKENLQKHIEDYSARIVDRNGKDVTLELVDVPEKIDSFINLMKEHGIIDISRTGVTAINKRK